MKDHIEIGRTIAREIFAIGDEAKNPCQRIEFKGGKWPDEETNNGGIGEGPLAGFIADKLKDL